MGAYGPPFGFAWRYTGCLTPASAKGNHIVWRWPEDEDWIWCSDKHRKKDPRRPPQEPRPARSMPAVPPAPPKTAIDMTWVVRNSWPWFDFRMQATVGAASVSLALCREWTYVQLDFEQNDFPWTWKQGSGEEFLVHSQCTFIASLAAACHRQCHHQHHH